MQSVRQRRQLNAQGRRLVAHRSLALERSSALAYDRLVVAVGSVMRRPTIAGVEHAFSIDTQADAIAFDMRLAELAAPRHGGPLTIAVVGAGFTGIELALELRDRVGAHDARAGQEMRIVLIDRNSTVGSDLGPNPKPFVDAALIEADVETRLGASIVAITPSLVSFADGTLLPADAVVLTTGLQAASFVEQIPGVRDGLAACWLQLSATAPA